MPKQRLICVAIIPFCVEKVALFHFCCIHFTNNKRWRVSDTTNPHFALLVPHHPLYFFFGKVDTYPKLKCLVDIRLRRSRGEGSITMKNSCCHSIIAVPLGSATHNSIIAVPLRSATHSQRMITTISHLKPQTHTFSHQNASKTKKWSIFILIKKNIVNQ